MKKDKTVINEEIPDSILEDTPNEKALKKKLEPMKKGNWIAVTSKDRATGIWKSAVEDYLTYWREKLKSAIILDKTTTRIEELIIAAELELEIG